MFSGFAKICGISPYSVSILAPRALWGGSNTWTSPLVRTSAPQPFTWARFYKTKREKRVKRKDRLKEMHQREAKRGLLDSEHAPFTVLWDPTDPYHNQKLLQKMDSGTLARELLKLGVHRVRQVREYHLENPYNYLEEAVISIEKSLGILKKSLLQVDRKLMNDAHVSYAIAKYYTKYPESAISRLLDLRKDLSYHPKVDLWLAHNYKLAGVYEEAVDAYTLFIGKHKASIKNPIAFMYEQGLLYQAVLCRGICYSISRNFQLAKQDFTFIVENKANTDRITLSNAFYRRAENEFRSRTPATNWNNIIDDCTEALCLDSHLLDAFYIRSRAYKELGKAELANADKDFHSQLCKIKLVTLPMTRLPMLDPRITKDVIEVRARH